MKTGTGSATGFIPCAAWNDTFPKAKTYHFGPRRVYPCLVKGTITCGACPRFHQANSTECLLVAGKGATANIIAKLADGLRHHIL